MLTRRKASPLAVSAAVAGIIAGAGLTVGCTSKKVAEKPTEPQPTAERNGCSGANGCNGQHTTPTTGTTTETKEQTAGGEANGCNSANGCKGH
jgi:hypothetical protein